MVYGLNARDPGGIFDRSHVLPTIRSHEPRAKGDAPRLKGFRNCVTSSHSALMLMRCASRKPSSISAGLAAATRAT
jgi:hypothetical protein